MLKSAEIPEEIIMERRTKAFRRNDELEKLLKEINSLMGEIEYKAVKDELNEYPIIFIVGAARTGSTLCMQWLAETGQIAYPTNLLSRFYEAPVLGAKIQMLLTDEKYNFRNEILDFNSEIDFKSDNGKTKGALSPNEFWYFWRRFLPFAETDIRNDGELLNYTGKGKFKRELLGLANIYKKPFALKGMICNYNIKFLNKLFPKALFIYTKREISANILSLLEARIRQNGDKSIWYSFKIPEYSELIKIDNPEKQVAGQIYCINKAIQNALKDVDESRKITIQYEEFCEKPAYFYHAIIKKLQQQGYNLQDEYIGPEKFSVTRKDIDKKLLDYYDLFCNEYGKLFL